MFEVTICRDCYNNNTFIRSFYLTDKCIAQKYKSPQIECNLTILKMPNLARAPPLIK